MYTILRRILYFLVSVVLCAIIYAILEVVHFKYLKPENEEEEKQAFEGESYWTSFALVAFVIEVSLCGLIYSIRNHVNQNRSQEQAQAIPENQGFEMSYMHGDTDNPNTVGSLAERIRRAGEEMDRRVGRMRFHYVPVSPEEVERY